LPHPTKAAPGQSVSVSDAPSPKTYWWLATLAVLGALLGGGPNPRASITAQVGNVPASSTMSVSPAAYSGQIILGLMQGKFTPPH
jgi:MYXO-CTERM domain-containing protein